MHKKHTIFSVSPNLIQSRRHPTSAARPLHRRLSDQLQAFPLFHFNFCRAGSERGTRDEGGVCVIAAQSERHDRGVQLVRLHSFSLAGAHCLQRHESQAFNPGHVSTAAASHLLNIRVPWRSDSLCHLWTGGCDGGGSVDECECTWWGRLWRRATPLLIPAASC